MTDDEIEIEADRLVRSGYRPISNRHRTLSRIDRPDWRTCLARALAPWDASEGADRIAGMREVGDFYRRVHSKDKLEIDRALFDAVKKHLRHIALPDDEFVAPIEPSILSTRAGR